MVPIVRFRLHSSGYTIRRWLAIKSHRLFEHSNDTYVADGQQAPIEEQEHAQGQKSDSKRDEPDAHLYDESRKRNKRRSAFEPLAVLWSTWTNYSLWKSVNSNMMISCS